MSRIFIALASAAMLLPVAAHAQIQQAGVHVSTLGAGAELGYKLDPHFSVRGVAQGFDLSHDSSTDDIAYSGKFKLGSAGLLVDYRPTEDGNFYLTGGLYANSNKVSETATPTQNTEIGSQVYTPAQIGTLSVSGKYKSAAPYLGLGWDFPIGNFAINIEAGAYFQGKSNVTLTSNGSLASNSAYLAELEKERLEVKDVLDKGQTWPVASVGLRYKF